eukprot:1138748-Pelagomonas_calceolata.AAC.1
MPWPQSTLKERSFEQPRTPQCQPLWGPQSSPLARPRLLTADKAICSYGHWMNINATGTLIKGVASGMVRLDGRRDRNRQQNHSLRQFKKQDREGRLGTWPLNPAVERGHKFARAAIPLFA